MKVIVLGAGVIGVATAYYLARSGNEVIVLDKSKSPAQGCSLANGGQLSYSHIDTWSNKSAVMAMLKSLVLPNTHINLNDFKNKEFYRWLFDFVKNSSLNLSSKNSEQIFAISSLSKILMQEILQKEQNLNRHEIIGKSFDYQTQGILHFYKNKKLFNADLSRLERLNHLDINYKVLNPEECLQIEPSLQELHNQKKLFGGIYFADDASGDCAKFTNALAKICQEKYGVEFVYNCEIKNIFTNYKKITGINTEDEVLVADSYVYCLGASSIKLLQGIGINTSIYPVKGYSLSIKCKEGFEPLKVALTDSENKIFYSKLGNILRIAGTIEMSQSNTINQKNIDFLQNNAFAMFGDNIDIDNATKWVGARPFRANSIPLIGNIDGLDNFLLNTGHGSLGWTHSLASGKIIDDLITSKKTKNLDFLSQQLKNIYKIPHDFNAS